MVRAGAHRKLTENEQVAIVYHLVRKSMKSAEVCVMIPRPSVYEYVPICSAQGLPWARMYQGYLVEALSISCRLLEHPSGCL